MLRTIQKFLNCPRWLTFTLVFGLFFAVSMLRLDPDLGWHITAGQYFAAHGIPATDPFTYTAPDFPWVDHEPLSDIIVAWLYSKGGHFTLAVLFAGLWTLALWLVSKRKKSFDPPPLVFLAALATLPYAGVRTITWSFLGLAILIRLMESRRGRWFIPLLFLIWANLHGSFFVGIIYLVYVTAYGIVFAKRRRAALKSSRPLIAVSVASVLASVANPYGLRIYEEIFRTLGDNSLHQNIIEWMTNLPVATAVYLSIFALALPFSFRRKDIKEYFRVENCFLLAALVSQRHWPLFVIVSLGPTTERFRSFLPGIIRQAKTNRPLRRIVLAALAAIVGFTAWGLYSEFDFGSWSRESNSPTEAVLYLQQNPCTGNLFNEYNDGGYLIQHLPSHKVFIDGRMPSWEYDGVNYMQMFNRILGDEEYRNERFAEYGISCALVFSDREEMIKSLESKGWQAVVESDKHTLLVEE
jgi:hypothetical protein